MNVKKMFGFALAVAMLFATATVQAQMTVRPWQSGNAEEECERAGGCGEFSYKIDGWQDTGMDGDYLTDDGNLITIYDSNGTTFSWSSEWPVCTVIVKGGPDANVYYYPAGSFGDTALVAPVNLNNNKLYGISHVTFCYNEPELCWKDETAWAAGDRYVDQGNWATFTEYDPEGLEVILYAGQTHKAGIVTFSAPVNGEVEICIVLNPGFRFADVEENVKIQDYEDPPFMDNPGGPSPGGFAHKGEADPEVFIFCINVPENNFYGVHVDVERQVECED